MYSQEENSINNENKTKDIFREVEKFYRVPPKPGTNKRKIIKPTDLSNVVDFYNIEANSPYIKSLIREVNIQNENLDTPTFFQKFTKVYTLTNLEGLYFIPCPFTPEQQRYWIYKCLKQYSLDTVTNLSNLRGDSNETRFHNWESINLKELRWASLGYHFQWTQRIYTEEHKGLFPPELQQLCQELAAQLGYEKYFPEGAIVNYYPNRRCMMGGHLDNAEEDLTKPIVSCSFGNTVIFLIGGETKSTVPTAIFVRSGDVVIMGGRARYCYHGVPRMISDSCPNYLKPEAGCLIQFPHELQSKNQNNTENNQNNLENNQNNLENNQNSNIFRNVADWIDCSNYMLDARININARQVRVRR
eukprot:TRINITY_DN2038_c3_g1_i1.p1 TRINITY_DN2038_c3_g1~~TRINITY_DN2038_c3_g1_i1.p1  ORF type:complete len:386 (+),score=152.28 TRINITY_DN2038_c3_g1_i1:82-1158(+)